MLSSCPWLIRIYKHGEQTQVIRNLTISFVHRRLPRVRFSYPLPPVTNLLLESLSGSMLIDTASAASRIKTLWNCHEAFEAYVPLLNALRVFISPHLSSFAEELSGPHWAAVMNSKEKNPERRGPHTKPDRELLHCTVCAARCFLQTRCSQ